ncbi:MAG: hypothetical protein IKQ68_04130 [Prevotella sp.]|nr:hypothetical protein [Prevotella sp.]
MIKEYVEENEEIPFPIENRVEEKNKKLKEYEEELKKIEALKKEIEEKIRMLQIE